MVLISLLVILVCKVIIAGLRIAVFLSVEAVSVHQSVGCIVEKRCDIWPEVDTHFFWVIAATWAQVPVLSEDCLCWAGGELGSGSQ